MHKSIFPGKKEICKPTRKDKFRLEIYYITLHIVQKMLSIYIEKKLSDLLTLHKASEKQDSFKRRAMFLG